MKRRVCAAMSGGVDSSVAAALLKEQGFEVCGVTMKLMDNADLCDESSRSCCGYDASRDAKMVADVLGISHYVINATKEFSETVVDNFVDEYKNGRTPNPCIRCNYYVKFDFLWKKARELGCDFLATGHYANMDNGVLRRGLDELKDQSYFLYPVYASNSKAILFPVGHLTKVEVRDLAAQYALPTAQKRESQDICFIPDGDYGKFLSNYGGLQKQDGHILNVHGKVIGKHTGIYQYTIGQRKGLGALGKRMFVKEIRPQENVVVAATDDECVNNAIVIRDLVGGGFSISQGESFLVQIRYRSRPVNGKIEQINGSTCTVRFDEPARAVAAGQSAVLYRDDIVVGGGIIDQAID